MKTILTTFFPLSLLSAGIAQQVHRVNNNPGISGTRVYSTFAAAHTAAASNDIILVEPSSTSYGTVTITKPLKIYGNGYFLTTNTGLKADSRNSTFDVVEFNTGSGGSEIYGVTAGTIVTYGVSNMTISRNHVTNIQYNTQNKAGTTQSSVSNLLISRNYITSVISPSTTPAATISNVLVTNNILPYLAASYDPAIQNWVVRNNSFYGSSVSTSLVNSVLENNFFYGGGGVPQLTNVTSSYNISTGTVWAGIGNEGSYDIITDPPWLGGANDASVRIKPGDPLKTKGNGNSEVGAFGGSTPYILSGIPAIPSVVNMVNSGTGDNTNPVKVTITVKSNN